MKLQANCTMTVKASADCPLIAMLRPRSGHAQWIISDRYALRPWVPTTEYVDGYGNLCQRLVVPQGEMNIAVEVTMEVEDQIAVAPDVAFISDYGPQPLQVDGMTVDVQEVSC